MKFLKRQKRPPQCQLRHGAFTRWLKMFLRIDPLVGMYFVSYPVYGIVLARIQTPARYLIHIYNPTGDGKIFENHLVSTLDSHHDFFYSLEEAYRFWEWVDDAKPRPQPQLIRPELQN